MKRKKLGGKFFVFVGEPECRVAVVRTYWEGRFGEELQQFDDSTSSCVFRM